MTGQAHFLDLKVKDGEERGGEGEEEREGGRGELAGKEHLPVMM